MHSQWFAISFAKCIWHAKWHRWQKFTCISIFLNIHFYRNSFVAWNFWCDRDIFCSFIAAHCTKIRLWFFFIFYIPLYLFSLLTPNRIALHLIQILYLQLIPNFLASKSAKSLQYPSYCSLPSTISPGLIFFSIMYGSSMMVVTIYVRFLSKSSVVGLVRSGATRIGTKCDRSDHSATLTIALFTVISTTFNV